MAIGPMAVALATATLIAGAPPAVAAGARAWHPPIVIAPAGAHPGDPAGALAARGEAIAAWAATSRGRSRVEARLRRRAVAAWVRVPLSGTMPRAPRAVVADIDAGGAAVVAWRVPSGRVRAAVRDRRDGAWQVLTVAPRRPVDEMWDFSAPALAIDARGAATLVWGERHEGVWTVRAARRARGGAWSETAPLVAGSGTTPSLALAPGGTGAVAAWTVPAGGSGFTPAPGPLRVARRAPDGSWSGPAAPIGVAVTHAVAIGDGGRAVVAFDEWPSGTPAGSRALVAVGAPDGSWGGPEPLAEGRAPRVATNARGDDLVTWAAAGGDSEVTPILSSARRADEPWPAPQSLTAGVSQTWIEASQARVALADNGRAFAGWLQPEGPGSATVGLATALAGGSPWDVTWQPVGGDEHAMALDASPSGDALALLPSEGGTGRTIRAVDYDAALRPVLSARGRGVTLAGGAVRWTVTVRNSGRVRANGVRLRLSVCCGARLLAARPCWVRGAGPLVNWRLGTIAAGRAAVVRLTIRPRSGERGRLIGTVWAVAVAPTGVSSVARP